MARCSLCGMCIDDGDALCSELTEEPLCEACYELESEELEGGEFCKTACIRR